MPTSSSLLPNDSAVYCTPRKRYIVPSVSFRACSQIQRCGLEQLVELAGYIALDAAEDLFRRPLGGASGCVLLGEASGSRSLKSWRDQIAYMAQDTFLSNDVVRAKLAGANGSSRSCPMAQRRFWATGAFASPGASGSGWL
jgi:hypothetical protein